MPKLLTTPFATSGSKNNVPTTTGLNTNSATYEKGFPDITMKSFAFGGLPPAGKDFNGIFYDITDNIVYQTQGGRYKFDSAYANSIKGYPLGAILLLNDGVTDVVSTVANNLTDPNVSMTGWKLRQKDSGVLTWSGRTQEEENKGFVTSALSANNVEPIDGRLAHIGGVGIQQRNDFSWNTVISNDSASRFNHHLDVQCKFPWAFSDYEAQLTSLGLTDSTGYIMCGGFTIVEEDNSLWTISGMDTVSYLRKYDLSTGAELGFYKLNTTTIAEGLVITNYYGGWKAFVGGRQDGYINEFNISLTPDGSLLNIHQSHFVDLYNQFAFRDGVWVCESKTPEIANYTMRNVMNVFNANFEPTGQFKLPVWSSGQITDSTTKFSKSFNKRQGFAIGQGFIVCSYGGAYDSFNSDHLTDRTRVQGIRIYGFDGSLLHESMFKPNVMRDIMQEQLSPAYTQTRIENEGVFVDSQGNIYTLFFYASRSQSLEQRKAEGIVVFKHRASKTSFDYSRACTTTPMFDLQNFGTLARYNVNDALNPLTGEVISNVSQLLELIRLTNIPQIRIITGGTQAITDIDGVTLPNGIILEINSLTAFTYIIKYMGTSSSRFSDYVVQYNTSTGTYSKSSCFVKLASTSDATRVYSRLLANTHNQNPQTSSLLLDSQDTGNQNLLLVGGGSGLFSSATEIRFMVSSTYSGSADYSGSWHLTPTSLKPRTDNYIKLGDANARINAIYATTSTINTSDERYKQQFRTKTEAEKAAALEIKANICLYKFNDAVDLKGDGARWHVDVKAQQVISILESHDLNPFDYGFVCFDEWDEQEEIVETWGDEFNEDGSLIREAGSEITQEYREAGSRYAIRYDELAMFILAAI